MRLVFCKDRLSTVQHIIKGYNSNPLIIHYYKPKGKAVTGFVVERTADDS